MPLVFDATVVATFDDATGGNFQRLFDFSNGMNQDEIILGNFSTTNSIMFETINDGIRYRMVVEDAIVDGEEATWRATIDDSGEMRVYKDGVQISDMQTDYSVIEPGGVEVTPDSIPSIDAIPADVPRTENLIGESAFPSDDDLIGEIKSISIETTLENGFDITSDTALDDVEEFEGSEQSETTDASENTDGIHIDGAEGDDSIIGGSGDDEIVGGEGNDTVVAGDGNDLIADSGLAEDRPTLITHETFEENAEGWSHGTVSSVDGFGEVFGRFGRGDGTEETSKSYDLDSSKEHAVIEFDFIRGDSWDGEHFKIFVDGNEVFSQYFAATENARSLTSELESGDTSYDVSVVSTQASSNFGGSHWNDQIYKVRIEVENPGEQLTLGFGSTLDQSETDESWSIDNLTIISTDDITASGVDGMDVVSEDYIDAGAGDDTVQSGGGDDTVLGGQGNDLIDGRAGDDDLSGGLGSDTIVGGQGDDTIAGGDGEDSIDAGIGHDSVSGGAGDDAILGGSGNDTIEGNDGADTISGGHGDDSIDGGDGADHLEGGDGDDSVVGGAGDDTALGGDGDDTLAGGEGADTISGGQGQDSIDGGDGADSIDGGEENDTIIGGAGNDVISDSGTYTGPPVLIASENFEDGANGWSDNNTGEDAYFGNYLGNHGASDGSQAVSKTFDLDASKPAAVIEFDFIRGDSWDGEKFNIFANDTEIFSERFFHSGGATSSDEAVQVGETTYSVSLERVEGQEDLGGRHWFDDIYKVRIEVENPDDTLKLGFGSTLNQHHHDEFWGVDNLNIISANSTSDQIGDTEAVSSDDVIDAGEGDDTVEAGVGRDTVEGGEGNDVIYGDSVRIDNGDFNSDQAADSWSQGDLEGWENEASSGRIEKWGDGFQGLNAASGDTFIELDVNADPNGIDHVKTNVRLEEGEDYTITFDAAARPGFSDDSFEVVYNGEVIATITPDSDSEFTTYSVTVTGTAGDDTFGFREMADENNGAGILLDNVRVELTDYDEDAFDDTIDGGAGDDVIYGQEGDDSIDGGSGNDSIEGGAGNDTIDGGIGNDTINGGAGDDVIRDTGIEADPPVLIASEDYENGASGWSDNSTGDETAFGKFLGYHGNGDGSQQVSKSFDLDTSKPVAIIEFDFIRGDSWGSEDFKIFLDDHEVFSEAFRYDDPARTLDNQHIEGDTTYSVSMTADQDSANVGGTSFEEQVYKVRIEIENPGDAIKLGFGSTLNQAANDEYWGIDNLNILSANSFEDQVSDLKSQTADDLIDAGDGNDTVEAGQGDDTVQGGEGDDRIFGQEGDDSIEGGAGNDKIVGGVGRDTLLGGEGNDTIEAGDGTNTLDEADYIDAGAGDDWVRASDRDTVYGGEGDDTIIASVGTTDFRGYGGEGNDVLQGANGNQHLYGGDGNDTITGGDDYDTADSDTLVGGAGDDSISSGQFRTPKDGFQEFGDVLDGGEGNDTLDGGAADDTIIGGSGDDSITGGEGDDTFVFEDDFGRDVVRDFDLGDDDGDGKTNDQIDVSGLVDANGNPVNAWDINVSDDGNGNAMLTFPNGEALVLEGVAVADVQGADKLASMGVPCFASGTKILTDRGEIDVARLKPGHKVVAADGSLRKVSWVGHREVTPAELSRIPELRPIIIRPGALGNPEKLVVSQQHGVKVGNYLVRARHLAEVCGGKVARMDRTAKAVTYHHFLLEEGHALVLANGILSESMWPGAEALSSLGTEALMTLIAAYPALFDGSSSFTSQYPGPALPYATRADLRSGRLELRSGTAMSESEAKRVADEAENLRESTLCWFI